jgi:hypothetical protein
MSDSMSKYIWKTTLLLAVLLMIADGLEARKPPSPNRAMLYSAIFPGGGQLYNREYLKAGLVIGVQGYLIGSAIYHDAKRDDYQELLDSATDPILIQQYRFQRDAYKESLTNDFWWMGITAALSMVDAYVDAHLWDFNSQKQKIQILFEDSSLQLRYRF